MKVAIHHRVGSFSDRWIEYCKKEGIDFKIVNAYSSCIVEQVADCDAFMWHFHHADYRDALFAKQLIFSLEETGKRCFPNSQTAWHFDDKVGQKYLLEAVGAPFVPSYVFFTKEDALKWIDNTTFPKVFKLRGGAGASNVSLVQSKKKAKLLVEKAFTQGFSSYNRLGSLKDSFEMWLQGRGSIKDVTKKTLRLFSSTKFAKMHSREKGYVFFQDFVPNNLFDIRVIVINGNAFAIKRMVRKGDFRASGSGIILYDRKEIPEECVRVSFEVAHKLNSQCLALDYVFDSAGKPSIVEIGYGFATKAYDLCPGFWTENLDWHEGTFNPQEWMVKGLLD